MYIAGARYIQLFTIFLQTGAALYRCIYTVTVVIVSVYIYSHSGDIFSHVEPSSRILLQQNHKVQSVL